MFQCSSVTTWQQHCRSILCSTGKEHWALLGNRYVTYNMVQCLLVSNCWLLLKVGYIYHSPSVSKSVSQSISQSIKDSGFCTISCIINPPPHTACNIFYGYIEMSKCLFLNRSTDTDETLHRYAVCDLRMCMREDNSCPNFFKGDN